MKIRININTRVEGEPEKEGHRATIWEGELEILDSREYLTMVTIIAEGKEHPICQVPFSPGIGYYRWVSPEGIDEVIENMPEYPESRDF